MFDTPHKELTMQHKVSELEGALPPPESDLIFFVYSQQAYESSFKCIGWYATEAQAQAACDALNMKDAEADFARYLTAYPREGRWAEDGRTARDMTFDEWCDRFNPKMSGDYAVESCRRGIDTPTTQKP